jgi:MFS family permease
MMTAVSYEEQPYRPPENGFRTFLILWATQSVSAIGSALTFFAITIWLTQVLYPAPEQKAQLAFALSIVSLAFGVPTVLIAPISGAWADRHDRKTTMILVDFFSGMLSVLLVILIVTHTLQLWMVALILVLFSLSGSFHGAAFDTSYAMLVPEKQLPRANGMMQTLWSLSGIISPAIAAALIALPSLARQGAIPGWLGDWLGAMQDGSPLAIGIDAVTFFAAAAIPLLLFVPSPRRAAGRPKTLWADIQEGALFIWRRRAMLWLLACFTAGNLFIAFSIVQRPLIVKFNLASDWGARGFTFETALALVSSLNGFGGLAGGFLVSAWGGLRSRRVLGVLFPLMLVGVSLIFYGASPWLFLTAGVAAVWAAMLPIMNAHSQAIWQSITPHALQGRVFAVRRVIAQISIPFGTLLGGSIGGLINPGLALVIAGVLMVLFIAAQLFNPSLMGIENKAGQAEQAGASLAVTVQAAEAD